MKSSAKVYKKLILTSLTHCSVMVLNDYEYMQDGIKVSMFTYAESVLL
jgi:hypothetical protein